ncbi:MAG: hypothetical protein GY852_08875 [bacterium]|nr:hypothetical protein [bacterium]
MKFLFPAVLLLLFLGCCTLTPTEPPQQEERASQIPGDPEPVPEEAPREEPEEPEEVPEESPNPICGDGILSNGEECDPGSNETLCSGCFECINCECIKTFTDADHDCIPDESDNCLNIYNPSQSDQDEDGLGDECDECPQDPDNDADGDRVCGNGDNCPEIKNRDQIDSDSDGVGDECDPCPNDPEDDIDEDGVCGDEDNCPETPNPKQEDHDLDGKGDECDSTPVECSKYCASIGHNVYLGEGLDDDECFDEAVEYIEAHPLDPEPCEEIIAAYHHKIIEINGDEYTCCCLRYRLDDINC